MNKDYYNILGVSRDADEKAIKQQFRKLAAKWHPDKHVNESDEKKKEAEEKFKEINEAYSILSDPEKKRMYDTYGTVDINGMNGGGFGPDIDEFFRNMGDFNPFGNHFSGFNSYTNKGPLKGENCHIKVKITLEDCYTKPTKKVRYRRNIVCHNCNGTGSKDGEVEKCPICNGTGVIVERKIDGFSQFISQKICSHCNGTGKVIKHKCDKCNGTGLESCYEEIDIKIGDNVLKYNIITFRGKGHMCPGENTVPGDLIVSFELEKHPIFEIGNDRKTLACKTDVNVLDCIIGGEKDVKCIDGKRVKISIPKFSKDGDSIIVKGKGLDSYSDMYVFINMVMPKSLTDEEIKKIEELKNSKNFKK